MFLHSSEKLGLGYIVVATHELGHLTSGTQHTAILYIATRGHAVLKISKHLRGQGKPNASAAMCAYVGSRFLSVARTPADRRYPLI